MILYDYLLMPRISNMLKLVSVSSQDAFGEDRHLHQYLQLGVAASTASYLTNSDYLIAGI